MPLVLASHANIRVTLVSDHVPAPWRRVLWVLGLTGFVILHFWSGGATSPGMQAVRNTFNSFTLTAIPLFILLGEILVASGLARNVYRAMSPLSSRLPGGLLQTDIAVCGMFGAVSAPCRGRVGVVSGSCRGRRWRWPRRLGRSPVPN